MIFTYLGELSIGAMIPGPVAVIVLAQAEVQAQLDAMIAFQAQLNLPPSPIDELISLCQQMLASLEQMLALGLPVPTLNLQLTAVLAAVATLRLKLQPFLDLGTLLAVGGVFAYVYDGATNGAGAALTTALAAGFPGHGATDHCDILVMGAVAALTWSAMGSVFKTS